MRKPTWRINHEIRANKLRVINADGEFVGELSLSEALAEAEKAKTDLVEIAPGANPPVAKIIDFGKFKYTQDKKERAQKKKAKPAELKEVRLSPFIAEGDYQTRIRRINHFLKHGHKVRVVIVFKGRHLGKRDRGYELMKEILDSLTSEVSIDMEPKFLGRHLAMVISPLKSRKTDTKNAVEKPTVS